MPQSVFCLAYLDLFRPSTSRATMCRTANPLEPNARRTGIEVCGPTHHHRTWNETQADLVVAKIVAQEYNPAHFASDESLCKRL